MIERRASLAKDINFESGLKLKRGTMIYVEETEHGAIGSYYDNPSSPSSSCFALAPDDYTVWVRADTPIEYLVVEDMPPEPTEERLKREELAKRRIRSKIRDLRKEADKLELLLARR